MKAVNRIALTLGVAIGTLAGGAAGAHPARETIRYAVSPCYGTCPVYSVAVTPDGTVTFEGERHTAVRGKRERQAGRLVYRRLARALAPYRPASGTSARTQCAQQVSDQPGYRIAWTGRDGAETVLEHDRGCFSPRNAALNQVMDAMPKALGIGPWIKAAR
ncbi:MAG: DUF6438 domain-containing protein [Methylorubrum populi]